MQNQRTWLDAREASSELDIRPSRLAQLMRTRLIGFVTAVGGPLFHRREIEWFASNYPALLESFRVEKEVDNVLTSGELQLCTEAYPPDHRPNSVICAKRRQGPSPRVCPDYSDSREAE